MNMLSAYAHQVVSYHPPKHRDELFAEIYDDLCEEFTEMKEKNAELEETEFLNATRPHPVKYATQLAAEGSAFLVGPQFYFSFLSALKIAVSIVVTVHVVLGVLAATTSGEIWGAFWGVMLEIPQTLLWVCASVLGVFVALEKSGERATWLDKWDAKDLKPLDGHGSISRFETTFDLAFSTFALLWVLDVIRIPPVIRHDGQWLTDMTSALPDSIWPVAAVLLLFDIGFGLYRLNRTLWTRRLRWITVGNNLPWLALLAYAASFPQLVVAGGEIATELLPLVNKASKALLMIIFVVIAVDTLKQLWQLYKGRESTQ